MSMEAQLAKSFTGNHLVLLCAIGVSTFFLKGLLKRFDAMNITLITLVTKVALLEDRDKDTRKIMHDTREDLAKLGIFEDRQDTIRESIHDLRNKVTKVSIKAGQCHAKIFGQSQDV